MKEVNKRVWYAGVMLLLSGALVTATAQQLPAVKEAKKQIEMDQTSKAVNTMQEAVKANPDDASLLYYLGYAQIKNGEKEKAEISFQKVLDKDPKQALGYAGKGHLRMLDNQDAEAKTAFNQALTMTKSKNQEVLKAVAEGYLEGTKYGNEALAVLQKAKAAGDPEVYILLGDAYLELNDGGKAVSNYENAASADPKNALGQYKAGLVFLRSKNYEVAENHFKKAIQVDPNYTLAYKELGELYYSMGPKKKDPKEAVKAYEKYLSLTEKPEEGKLRYAFFLFMAKDYEKANAIFEELSKRPNVSPTVWKYWAYSLTESGDLEKAQTIFDQYFQKVPAAEIQGSDYVYYGNMLQKAGKDSLAILSWEKSLALEKDADVAQKVADGYYSKLKDYSKAIDAYNQLDTIKTRLGSQDLFYLGRSYYQTEQYGKADTTFQRLIEQQPNMTVGYFWQARSLANLDPEVNGKIQGLAKPAFEKVIEKGELNPEKNKNELIEAYGYMGYYHMLQNEISTGKGYFEKILKIDPSNDRAKKVLEELRKAAAAPKPQR